MALFNSKGYVRCLCDHLVHRSSGTVRRDIQYIEESPTLCKSIKENNWTFLFAVLFPCPMLKGPEIAQGYG